MSQAKFSQAKVILLENISAAAISTFEKFGINDVKILKTSIEEAPEEVFEANILGIRSRSKLSAEVLKKFKNLSCVGCFCIGTDQVDLTSAKKLGIPVFNAPFSNTRSVAELVIGEIISLYRRLQVVNIEMHKGIWSKNAVGCNEIKNKNLGIIGYGNIGAQVGILAESLGMNVFYHDIENKLPFGSNHQVNSLEELLKISDVITLHVPQDKSTNDIINKSTISKMKKGVFIINNSRGNVVDIEALAEALESKHVAGAAIDVFPVEPASNAEEFISPLRKFDNALLTPHIGGSTQEAQENIAIEVANKLAQNHLINSTAMAVNFPNLALQKPKEGCVRISHVHKNTPGMLQSINQEISKYGLNIQSQILSTDSEIGYVVLDVESSEIPQGLDIDLKAISGTVSVRILK
ncbi:MAG: phosphoglycerate dehydrogenase [Pelagibacterales bacterium]|nr:phosphoglycerate dehydrogenase [Pelagibacterales bacterium]